MTKDSAKVVKRVTQPNTAGSLVFISVLLALLGLYQELTLTIQIRWKTASQLNLQGFNLLRSEGDEDSFLPINPNLIPVQGDRVAGSQYQYIDKQVQPGKTYYYKIEKVTIQGSREVISQTKVATDHPGKLALIFSGIFAFLALVFLWKTIINRSKFVEAE